MSSTKKWVAISLLLLMCTANQALGQSVKEEKVTFHNEKDDIALGATIGYPEGELLAAVVLIPVAGPSDRNMTLGPHTYMKKIADHLANEGIASIRYDVRGVGESKGSFLSTTFEDRATDACFAQEALSEFLGEEAEVSRGWVGMSEGGALGIKAADICGGSFNILLSTPVRQGKLEMKEQMDRMITMSALSDGQKELLKNAYAQFMQLMDEPSSPERTERIKALLSTPAGSMLLPAYGFVPRDPEGQTAFVESEWYQSQLNYDIDILLKEVATDLFAIYGTLDMVINPEMNTDYLRKMREDAEVIMIEGLNHLMQKAQTGSPAEYAELEESVSEEVLTEITLWIKKAVLNKFK